MTEPIDFRMLVGLQTALRRVRVADGFFHELEAAAVRFDADVNVEQLIAEADGPRPAVLIELDVHAAEFIEKPDGLRVTLKTIVHWIGKVDLTVDHAVLQALFRASADVERALAAPVTGDRSLGVGAFDTRLGGMTWQRLGAELWILFPVDVIYHRQYGDPVGA